MPEYKNKLKLWLKDNPMSASVFAKKIGVTKGYISHLTRDDRPPWPSRAVAQRIAKVTGNQVTPNDLLGIGPGD